MLLAAYVVLIRANRPFINEIILLERNPLRKRGGKVLTISHRSSVLHGASGGTLVSEWFGAAALAVLLWATLVGTVWFVWGTLLFDWKLDAFMLHVAVPASMWLVVLYLSVVHFMCYLDLRIRREGWEVELLVRAASSDLQGKTL